MLKKGCPFPDGLFYIGDKGNIGTLGIRELELLKGWHPSGKIQKVIITH